MKLSKDLIVLHEFVIQFNQLKVMNLNMIYLNMTFLKKAFKNINDNFEDVLQITFLKDTLTEYKFLPERLT